MHWWALHRAAGINFHTGEVVAAADENTPCFYAVFLPSARGYSIQPLGYAMKAFDLGGHGRIVPVRIAAASSPLNLTAYGVLSPGGELYITLINKEVGPDVRDAAVTINSKRAYSHVEMVRLEGPSDDISAKIGLALGGRAIQDNGAWQGAWKGVKDRNKTGGFEIDVPAHSAAILKFTSPAPVR